jgi:hypothetical protein
MLQLVKTKRQTNFKDFNRFGVFMESLRGSSNKKKRCIKFVFVQIGLFLARVGHFKTRVKRAF